MAPGKVLGAMLGLGVGLLIGGLWPVVVLVLAGVLVGHQLDGLLQPPARTAGTNTPPAPEPQELAAQQHFARHLCALFIEVARADGDLVRDEVRVVREYFAEQLRYGPESLELVRRYLKEHLARPPTLEDSAAACRDELTMSARLLLLDALYGLALVDGQLHRAEQETLRRIAQGLGLSEAQIRSVTARHFGEAQAHYTRLGLTPEASDADVKRAFRQLAAIHHPDRVAHLGPGAVEQASRRFQEIREAYEKIRQLRGG
nr:TerB family tellurite resistance protein [Cystobacter ferrugineus]